MKKTKVNFFCSGILPYYLPKNKKTTFLFEMKSEDYVPPFFNNSLSFLGGNRGDMKDESPGEVLRRELEEEFHVIEEHEESLNDLVGQKILQEQHFNYAAKPDKKIIEGIKKMPSILLEGKVYAGSYLVTFFPPVAGIKRKVTGVESIFLKKLSDEEYTFVDTLLKKSDERITTDNLRFGGKTLFVPLENINENKYKFSWDCGQIISDILKKGKIPAGHDSIEIRSLDNVKIESIHNGLAEKIGAINYDGPTFEDFRYMGFI